MVINIIINAVMIIAQLWIARHAVKYAKRLANTRENGTVLHQTPKLTTDAPTKSFTTDNVVSILFGVLMIGLNSWLLWRLVKDPSPITRGEVLRMIVDFAAIIFWIMNIIRTLDGEDV